MSTVKIAPSLVMGLILFFLRPQRKSGCLLVNDRTHPPDQQGNCR
jgi:hypothetical protein